MKVLVAINCVPDPNGFLRLTEAGALDTSLARDILSPCDAIALDRAWDWRQRGLVSEVVAVAVSADVGNSRWEGALLAARARGADRVLVALGDLAHGVGDIACREAPDVFLFGGGDPAHHAGQMGVRVAGILAWPVVVIGNEDDIPEQAAHEQTVIVCDAVNDAPRLLSLSEIMGAKQKPVERISLPEADDRAAGAAGAVAGIETRPARSECVMVDSVDALVNAMSVQARAGFVLEDSPGLYLGTSAEMMPLAWIAGNRNWPQINNVIAARSEGETLLCRRFVHGRRFIEAIQVDKPQDVILIVPENVRTPEQAQRVAALLATFPAPMTTHAAPLRAAIKTNARCVVAGGRALGDNETFNRLVGGLAGALGGGIAASGGATNSEIAPKSLLIGQTGSNVAPDLYIALGISGADQHVGGILESGCIVAINKDPTAPIFRVADFGLVADVHEAVPEMIARAREIQSG